KAGETTLKITYVGYEDVAKKVTIESGKTKDLGTIFIVSASTGIEGVEIFASVVVDRKTPVAVSKVGAIVIAEQLGGMELPEILNSTPGVYATKGNGSFGDARINIRGFNQEETVFMMNGVPLNDMENGRMFWSNFAGLSEVTRNMEVQRGLGASKLGVNSVGGTVNIITKPSGNKKGGKIEAAFGNGSWNNRFGLTLNTGKMKGGWAATFQGARITGNGYIDGAYVDAWSYYFALSKQINKKHSILFTAFGAPTDRGSVFTAPSLAEYDRLDNYKANLATGYLNGELFNTRQNKSHKPQISLMHLWEVNDKIFVTTSAYVSFARVYSTGNAQNFAAPAIANQNDGLINLEAMQTANLGNQQTVQNPYGDAFSGSVTGEQSLYYLDASHNDHNWYGIISNLNYKINSTTTAIFGVDFRDYTGLHYETVRNLYGGDYVLDQTGPGTDANLLIPNNVARKGDRIGYDYDGNVRWGSAFVQIEKTFADKFDAFASMNISKTQMWRYGNSWSGQSAFSDNSFGKSDVRVFNNFNFKLGLNYRVDGRNSVYVNAGTFTRAPFLRNSFADTRNTNNYLEGLKSERIKSAELGYMYRSSSFKIKANLYITEWNDRSFSTSFPDEQGNQISFAITGQGAVHQGFELEGSVNVLPNLEIKGMLSLGDWFWSNNVNSIVATEINGATMLDTVSVFAQDLPIGDVAQTTVFIGAHYKLKGGYIGARFNFFDDLYESFDPEEIDTEIKRNSLVPLPSYQMVDIYAGYFFKIGENDAKISANVHNLLDELVVRRQNRFGPQLGFLRNYNVSISMSF
ncbi:MAG: iron complex outermembrane receptor protein, partial [Arenicella sp.]